MTRRFFQLVILMAVIACSAMADPIIDFSGGFNSIGVIGSGGVGSTVVGANIQISQLLALDVPQHAGTQIAVTNGLLSFTTGTISSFDASSLTYKYNGGGSFKIMGGVAAAGIADGSTLLEGTFYDGAFSIISSVVVMQGNGTDAKNPALLSYFGVPSVPFTFTAFSIAANMGTVGKTGAFSALAFSTDIANTMAPEPSAILIMGTCLLFVGAQLRKRLHLEA